MLVNLTENVDGLCLRNVSWDVFDDIGYCRWIATKKGTREMNNEPVAWIDPYDLERLPLNDCWVNGEKSKWVDIPLYTHPAKTLTDEEIIEIGNAVTNLIDSNEGWIEFARAILRKAQEK